MRRVGLLVLVVTLVSALGYTAVSLARWEWNRAFFFGLVFLAAEIALASAWIASRVSAGRRESAPAVDPNVLAHLERTRPSPRRFEWLKQLPNQTNVFITLLVGGGVVVSGLAWALDRIASRTTTPAGERRLAAELRGIGYPDDGLYVDEVSVLAQDHPYLDDPQLRKLLRQPGHTR